MASLRNVGPLLLLCAAIGCLGRIDGDAGGGETSAGLPLPGGGGRGPSSHTPAETSSGPVSCDKPSVGVTPLKRLTRVEYVNSVHDITGLELDLNGVLPEDERIGSFFRNDVAPVSVHELAGYRDAAEEVAKRVATERKELWACSGGTQGAACASELIANLGQQLHRSPLPSSEQARYLTVFNAQGGNFEAGMGAVFEALLQSPFFLYRLELPSGATVGPQTLPSYELASRLSFLLWKSAPDAALLAKAQADQLHSPEHLRSEAARLLADPRAERLFATFHREWLGIAELGTRPKDNALFPDFSPQVIQRMQADAERFAVEVLLKGDGTLASLFKSPFTATIDGSVRNGILTQPAFLAAHASADQTSIVLRGNFVRMSLLCDAPPPPPPTVNATAPGRDANSTLRERFAAHEADPTCAGCHKLMDPVGFGFESYDAIGRFRATEAGRPVDASGEVVGSKDADGKFAGAQELAERLAASEQVRGCVTRQWFDYAFGRAVDRDDACAFQTAYDAYRANGDDIRALLLAFVTSDAFRLRAEAAP